MNCDGNEEILEDCEIGNLTSHECSEIGIAHCMNGKKSALCSNLIYLLLHTA